MDFFCVPRKSSRYFLCRGVTHFPELRSFSATELDCDGTLEDCDSTLNDYDGALALDARD